MFSLLKRRRLLTLALLPCIFPAFAVTSAQTESVHAIVTFPQTTTITPDSQARVESWKRAGLTSRSQLLAAQPGQDKAGFSSILLLDFRNEKAYAQWYEQAKKELDANARIRRADVVRSDGKAPPTVAAAVYVVSFYDTLVEPAAYKTYTDQYILPNMHSQQRFGVMARYAMYLERESNGTKGRSILVMEYKDKDAFARREEVKDKGAKKLLENPQWKQYNGTKSTIRTHTSETVAVAVGKK